MTPEYEGFASNPVAQTYAQGYAAGEKQAAEVIEAIEDQGYSPSYHRDQMLRLREEWPVLTRALVSLLINNGRSVPPEWRNV